MATNPFEALLTPETLKARREAEVVKKYSPMGFWATEMAAGGQKMRQALREQGVGLDAEDRRAALTQGLMQAGARSYAGMVKEGADPDKAREQVLMDTMREFLAAGDYQSAQTITAQLDALSKQRLERAKLKADAEKAEAWPEIEAAKLEIQAARAEAAGRTAEAAALRAENEALRNPSQIRLNVARAGQADRSPRQPAGGGGGGGAGAAADKGGDVTPSYTQKINDQVAGMIGLIENAEIYERLLTANPGLGSPVSGWLAQARAQGIGFLDTFRPKVSVDMLTGSERAIYDSYRDRIRKAANDLQVDRTVMEAVIIDLAYAIARTNDDGRLSNNDFDQALKTVGSSADASAAVATLRNTVGQRFKRIDTRISGLPILESRIMTIPEMRDRFKQWTTQGAPPPPAAPGTAPAAAAPPATGAATTPPPKKETAAERFRRLSEGK